MHNVNSMLILLAFGLDPFLQVASLLVLTGSLAFLEFLAFPKLSQFLLERFASSQIAIDYKEIVEPSLPLIQKVFGLAIADIFLLLLKPIIKISFLETTLGLSVAIALCYLAHQLISRGIDPRGTAVNFSKANGNGEKASATRGQVSLFILSSGNEVSMELRRQLLDIAGKKIGQKLTEYGVTYEIEQPRAYIDSPWSI